ncbi:RNA-binding S4 domain-containing protein [Loktanella sp. D2R18]|uniref:RNA-binding S4 domain-containing protein n=1 Tax=Rhodobacterales TaxID=204455 RepID=UPI000DE8E722|nr:MULTISPECIES: RNA-binding S4 domain-containing protein [Rhodobacterales]MDO6590266.1 RNA-binding S4 domain-containing protein [Yoonia sp. 1_MG-2023]RBW42925.1 RNA-binding S4 domain-containing protein [Loktanella sp. D2R18]
MTEAPRQTIRLDKWLWQARFFKSRSLAAGVVTSGKVRIDGNPVSKPARGVGAGDVLTFTQADATKVVRILGLGTRRGPAPEAQALYEDMSPVVERRPYNPGGDRKGRPTKKQRRDMMTHRATDASFDLE